MSGDTVADEGAAVAGGDTVADESTTRASGATTRPGIAAGWSRIPRWVISIGGGILGLVVFLGLANSITQFQDYQLSEVATFLVTVAGLTMLTGWSGQISLGQGALMMVGAYVAAVLSLHTTQSIPVVLVAATVGGAVVGALVGVVAARLRGPYLAGATLALAVALPQIPKAHAYLGADQGLTVNPLIPPGWMGPNATPERWTAFICIVAAVITIVVLANLGHSRFGRNFRAVRDDEIAASLAGIPVARTQVLAFIISAACAGLGGGLYAYVFQTVGPNGFTLALSIQLLVAMVIGGMGSLSGAALGAVLIVYETGWVTDFGTGIGLSAEKGANLAIAVFGAVLIIVILVLPDGIAGGLRRLWAYLVRRFRDRGSDAQPRVDIHPPQPDQQVGPVDERIRG
jgi:branched-chain amino acid transport system permease protein